MVYLYKKQLPNTLRNTHYIFTDPGDFWLELGDEYISFSEDTYRLNGNILEVELSVIDADTKYNEITYIVWQQGGNWRFYFVNSQIFQSGYAIYDLTLDVWATYISQAKINKKTLMKCNRKVEVTYSESTGIKKATGIYDPIASTQYQGYLTEYGEDYGADDIAVVFVAVIENSQSSILYNNASSYTAIFAKRLSTFSTPTINYALSVIGGIYGYFQVATPSTILDVNIIKAYLVPAEALKASDWAYTDTTFKFVSSSTAGSGNVDDFIICSPYAFEKDIVVPIDPDYKYIAGTKYAGLELIREVGATSVTYRFIVKQDGIEITVQQGDKMQDLTEQFRVGITTNDGNLTSYEKVARSLGLISGLASGVFQFASGGAGYVTGGLSIANTLTSSIVSGNGQYIAGGDGITTFTDNGEFCSPYQVRRYVSANNEKEHARLYGASYNVQFDDLEELQSNELLGSGTETDTYIEMLCAIDGVPLDAKDLIETTFLNGVYIKLI